MLEFYALPPCSRSLRSLPEFPSRPRYPLPYFLAFFNSYYYLPPGLSQSFQLSGEFLGLRLLLRLRIPELPSEPGLESGVLLMLGVNMYEKYKEGERRKGTPRERRSRAWIVTLSSNSSAGLAPFHCSNFLSPIGACFQAKYINSAQYSIVRIIFEYQTWTTPKSVLFKRTALHVYFQPKPAGRMNCLSVLGNIAVIQPRAMILNSDYGNMMDLWGTEHNAGCAIAWGGDSIWMAAWVRTADNASTDGNLCTRHS